MYKIKQFNLHIQKNNKTKKKNMLRPRWGSNVTTCSGGTTYTMTKTCSTRYTFKHFKHHNMSFDPNMKASQQVCLSLLAAVGFTRPDFQFFGEGGQKFTGVTRKWATANMQFTSKRFNNVVNRHYKKIPPVPIVLLKKRTLL